MAFNWGRNNSNTNAVNFDDRGGSKLSNSALTGEVTIGFNSAEIANARQKITDSYNSLCTTLEESRVDMINSIKACWFGPDCDKYVATCGQKLDKQNESVKVLFNTIADEATGLLTEIEKAWISFQDGVSFEDAK